MILRLIIAFTRWVWGVSPAFVTEDSAEWCLAMCFGAVLDLFVVGVLTIVLTVVIVDWIQSWRSK